MKKSSKLDRLMKMEFQGMCPHCHGMLWAYFEDNEPYMLACDTCGYEQS